MYKVREQLDFSRWERFIEIKMRLSNENLKTTSGISPQSVLFNHITFRQL
jgi:hypothetical protein